jgi:hypothetical protein
MTIAEMKAFNDHWHDRQQQGLIPIHFTVTTADIDPSLEVYGWKATGPKLKAKKGKKPAHTNQASQSTRKRKQPEEELERGDSDSENSEEEDEDDDYSFFDPNFGPHAEILPKLTKVSSYNF